MEFQEFQEVKLRALGRWTEIFISLAGLDPKICLLYTSPSPRD